MPRDETENSPLSRFDEYPIHQTADPIRIVETTDGRAHERYWFTAQSRDGSIFLVVGFGVYPNQDTVDGYAILVHEGRQTSVRFHRLLGDDRADMTCGPFSAELVTPFREWHLVLEDNPLHLAFDLRWRDSKRPVFGRMLPWGPPAAPAYADGRRPLPDVGYESFGRIEGVVRIGGQTLALDPEETLGSRDHHWGAVNGVGGPGLIEWHAREFTHLGQWVEFSEWALWGWRVLYNRGAPETGAGQVVKVENELWFDERTRHLRGGAIRNTLADGEVKEIHYEQVADQVAYLRCGMYHGVDGGTPDGDVHHGMRVTDDLLVTGEVHDITDPATCERIAGFDDHLCIATCDGETSIGILETKNPVLYEMCAAGVPGFRFGTS